MLAALYIRRLSSALALAASAGVSSTMLAQQQPVAATSRRLPHKDPNRAAVIGVLIPGGGQFYAERFGKAAAVFGVTALSAGIAIDAGRNGNSTTETMAIVAGGLTWVYGWMTAAHDARLFNDQMLNSTSMAPFVDGRNGRLLAGMTLRR